MFIILIKTIPLKIYKLKLHISHKTKHKQIMERIEMLPAEEQKQKNKTFSIGARFKNKSSQGECLIIVSGIFTMGLGLGILSGLTIFGGKKENAEMIIKHEKLEQSHIPLGKILEELRNAAKPNNKRDPTISKPIKADMCAVDSAQLNTAGNAQLINQQTSIGKILVDVQNATTNGEPDTTIYTPINRQTSIGKILVDVQNATTNGEPDTTFYTPIEADMCVADSVSPICSYVICETNGEITCFGGKLMLNESEAREIINNACNSYEQNKTCHIKKSSTLILHNKQCEILCKLLL